MTVTSDGLKRLAYQFIDSIKFNAFLTAFLDEFTELDISGLQLLDERYLDTAVGVQLDGIGSIVGIGRPTVFSDVADCFGFLGDSTSKGFTDPATPSLGGRFLSKGENETLATDTFYRLMIRAKIIENITTMTVEDTLTLISFIFTATVRYILRDNLDPVYVIGRLLTQYEGSLIRDLPILIGLDSVEYQMHSDTSVFGFFGDPGADGFSDATAPTLGGNFAAII